MKLYRFRKLDTLTIKYINDFQLHFSSPLKFNDPYDFDLDCLEISSQVDIEVIYEKYKELLNLKLKEILDFIKMGNARLFDRQASDPDWFNAGAYELHNRQYVHVEREYNILNSISPDDPEFRDKVYKSWERIKQNIAEDFGVVCFSKSQFNMLLWSHYADSHRGVCFEYDSTERPITKWKKYSYLPVEYSDNRRVDVSSMGFEQAIFNLLTTKGSDWAYEQEYRLITTRGPGYQTNRIPSLTSMIFGVHVKDNDSSLRNELYRSILALNKRRKPIKSLAIFGMEKVPFEYSIRPKQLLKTIDIKSFLGL